MAKIQPNVPFDVGIVEILTQEATGAASLPDTGDWMPGETNIRQELTELLFPPSIEQALSDSFRHRSAIEICSLQLAIVRQLPSVDKTSSSNSINVHRKTRKN